MAILEYIYFSNIISHINISHIFISHIIIICHIIIQHYLSVALFSLVRYGNLITVLSGREVK